MPRIGYLGLGSNLGERREHLQAAVAALGLRGVRVLRSSSVYDTEPVGDLPDQPEFLNACLRVRSSYGPEALLDVCKDVEHVVGREQTGVRHGPRVIDVDLLLLGELVHASSRLTLPHPEVSARRFVLVPLLELDHAIRLPGGDRLSEALARLGRGQEVRLAGPPLAI